MGRSFNGPFGCWWRLDSFYRHMTLFHIAKKKEYNQALAIL